MARFGAALSLTFALACAGVRAEVVEIGQERALAAIVPPVAGRTACFLRQYDAGHLASTRSRR